MDEAKEDEWAGVFRSRQAQLWRPNVYISLCIYSAGNFERNNFNF
jgi:hypothetical protein